MGSTILYGDTYQSLEHSRRLNILLISILAICMLGLLISAFRSKVKTVPFIVHGSEVFTLTNSDQDPDLSQRLAPYFAKEFIISSRTVSTDSFVNSNSKIAAYSFVSNSALKTLKDFYQKNNPTISQNFTKSIQITSILRLSHNTFSVRWKEDLKNSSGELIKSQKYISQLTYIYKNPSQNETVLKTNPMGFYITHLSWALDG